MTRDKAQSILERYSEGCYFCRPLEDLFNYIYDDFEQQLANLNSNLEAQEIMIADYKKRIEELENRSCYNCSKFIPYSQEDSELHFEDGKCLDSRCAFRVYFDFCCNEYEPKDK